MEYKDPVSVSEAIASILAKPVPSADKEYRQAFIDLLQEKVLFPIRRPDGAIAFRLTEEALVAAREDEIREELMPSLHRFGPDRPWEPADVAFTSVVIIKTLIPTGWAFAEGVCACDPQTDILPEPGGLRKLAGITHQPGCRWLMEAARTWNLT